MYGADYCHENDHEQNGSKAVSFLLRLSELVLALASAVVMATASATTVDEAGGGATATVTFKQYPPFVYLVGCNIVVAVLEAAAVYMQLVSKGDDDDEGGKIPRVLLVAGDAVVQALLYSSTGAVFAVGAAQISACADGGAVPLLPSGGPVQVPLARRVLRRRPRRGRQGPPSAFLRMAILVGLRCVLKC
ncbi:hypothetical protein ACP70R_002657 [Stipagrostis hirtigluma subsp. patula]